MTPVRLRGSVVAALCLLAAPAVVPQPPVHQGSHRPAARSVHQRTDHPELALLIHMDGQGTPAQKHATWRAVRAARPAGVPLGWKNFYDEDNPTFTPARTMAKRPRPVMISYQ